MLKYLVQSKSNAKAGRAKLKMDPNMRRKRSPLFLVYFIIVDSSYSKESPREDEERIEERRAIRWLFPLTAEGSSPGRLPGFAIAQRSYRHRQHPCWHEKCLLYFYSQGSLAAIDVSVEGDGRDQYDPVYRAVNEMRALDVPWHVIYTRIQRDYLHSTSGSTS